MRRGFALCLLLGLAGPAWGDAASNARLEEIKEAIALSRSRIESFASREEGLLEAFEASDRAAALLSRDLERARREHRQSRTRHAEARAELERLDGKSKVLKTAMSRRAVSLYKSGELGPVRALFSAGDLREFLTRSHSLRALLDHDGDLLVRFAEQARALRDTQEKLQSAAAQRDRAVVDLESRSRELRHERAAKRSLLARLRTDRDQERVALRELEAAAQRLEEKLERLDRDPSPSPSTGFARMRGKLRWPVDGSIIRSFGRVVDQEFRTAIFRKGVDFEAEAGTRVRSVAAGDVRFAGWFRGYGNTVIVDHGDRYFTVFAHLERIDAELGETVAEGDRLGTVGETGSLSGPLLYFEIRRGAQAQDPAEWLRAGLKR